MICYKESEQYFEKRCMIFLLKYSWPGNVRELEHIVEYAINQIDDWEDTLQMKDIEERIKKTSFNIMKKRSKLNL